MSAVPMEPNSFDSSPARAWNVSWISSSCDARRRASRYARRACCSARSRSCSSCRIVASVASYARSCGNR